MLRTRVGYAGGTSPQPTYHNLGDHTETLQVDFVPGVITYEALAKVFWASHDPGGRAWSRQYRNVLFYADEEQKAAALAGARRWAAEHGGKVQTAVEPCTGFHLAEEYHQKYRLRSVPELIREFRAMYPDWHDLTDSTAAARVNGLLAGYGDPAGFDTLLPKLGLSPEAEERLVVLSRRG